MDYELAKRLKAAGFPKGVEGSWFMHGDDPLEKDASAYCPTLEELFDECGRSDFKLRRHYSAYEDKIFYVVEIPGTHDMERQDTATAALAYFWIWKESQLASQLNETPPQTDNGETAPHIK
jgi:hypothetical protein